MDATELAHKVAEAVEARFCASVDAPGVITRDARHVLISMPVQGMIPANEILIGIAAPSPSDHTWILSLGYRPSCEKTYHNFVFYTPPRDFPRTLQHAIHTMCAHMERYL